MWNNAISPAITPRQRTKSPSMGRVSTSAAAQGTFDTVRRTLMPVEPPSRVPEVFLEVERGFSHHHHRHQNGTTSPGASTSMSTWRTTTDRRQPSPTWSARNVSPRAGRGAGAATNAKDTPALLREVMRGKSPPAATATGAAAWKTRRVAADDQHPVSSSRRIPSVSPHRTAHSHCIPMHSPSLARTTSAASLAAATTNNNASAVSTRSWIPVRSTSSSRANTPRWSDPLMRSATSVAHLYGNAAASSLSVGDFSAENNNSASSGLLPGDESGVDIHGRHRVATYRARQRSAGSTLPVCQTVGTDTSNCTCDDSGELMIQSIDALLRANGGDMSPARAKLARSNSSPVATRVENIVKKEVERRLKKEQDKIAEEARLKEEAQRAKQAASEATHRAATAKAQADRDSTNARLLAETAAREKAEAEKLAAAEHQQRVAAEAEAEKLRKELEQYDTKLISPGKIRIQEGVQPRGNAAPAGAVERGLNEPASPPPGGAEEDGMSPEDEEFSAFSSVRRTNDTKTSTPGQFDPVSSKALQRVQAMRNNIQRAGSTPGAAGRSPMAAAHASVGRSGGRGGVASPASSVASRAEVNSIISQLASAGSSPLGGFGSDEESSIARGASSTPRGGGGAVGGNVLFGGNSGGMSLISQQQVIPAPASPRGGAARGSPGKGGMLAPTVGLRERDEHVAELMRRTSERHAAVRRNAAGGVSSPPRGSAIADRPSAQLLGGLTPEHQQYGSISSSSSASPERSLFERSSGQQHHQQQRHSVLDRASLERELREPMDTMSPSRATGPHYSPQSLVDPPLMAGPSTLWVNRVQPRR